MPLDCVCVCVCVHAYFDVKLLSSGGCTNQWESFANTHAQGGVEQTTITTGSQCKQACIDNPDCVGVDIDDVRTPLCYLHLNIANLDQSKRGQLNGVTLNVLTRCVSSGERMAIVCYCSRCMHG